MRICTTVQRTPWSVDVADREATMNICGVVVAKSQGHSWAPRLSNGSRVNVGTNSSVPSSTGNQSAEGKTCRRLMPTRWGGGSVVVRGRESRPVDGARCHIGCYLYLSTLSMSLPPTAMRMHASSATGSPGPRGKTSSTESRLMMQARLQVVELSALIQIAK